MANPNRLRNTNIVVRDGALALSAFLLAACNTGLTDMGDYDVINCLTYPDHAANYSTNLPSGSEVGLEGVYYGNRDGQLEVRRLANGQRSYVGDDGELTVEGETMFDENYKAVAALKNDELTVVLSCIK